MATSSGRQSERNSIPPSPGGFLRSLGPGLITGASDDDPSGIATYAQAGASVGFPILWTALITFPMMWAIQYTCAKIGIVTGKGLTAVIKQHYSPWVLYGMVVGLFIANTITAGVDLGAIGAAVTLVAPIPTFAAIIPISIGIVIVQTWGSYRLIAQIFKWLTVTLFAYIASAFLSHPDWRHVLVGTLVPTIRLDKTFLLVFVAVLGTTITPYLFFWQSDQEVEEQISMGRRTLRQRQGATKPELTHADWDVATGMLFSNVVMFFIMLATASTLHRAGDTNIDSAAQAAQALKPLAGTAAAMLWAPGLIGVGILAVPILTGSAAYAVAQAAGWNYGLDEKPKRAKLFYGVIAFSTVIGVSINFLRINPIKALVWASALNGVLAPPMLVIVMLVANNAKVLGPHVNGRTSNLIGWTTTALMAGAAIALLLTI